MKRQKPLLILLSLLVLVILGIIASVIYNRYYPSTNDAYVNANVINIAPQVSGLVTQVSVADHQGVTAGQALVVIDPEPYQYALSQAEAELKLAQEQGERMFPLIAQGRLAPAEGDKIRANIQKATANVNTAKYNLAHTRLTAPAAGVLANFSVRVGDTLSQGTPLFAIVEQDNFWVDANFKETQLSRIRVGQSASIKLDMYPGVVFEGSVQSINPGTGSVFSLLPPENATGNWVKVTQRIPVKVKITHPSANFPLITGASATVKINTRQ